MAQDASRQVKIICLSTRAMSGRKKVGDTPSVRSAHAAIMRWPMVGRLHQRCQVRNHAGVIRFPRVDSAVVHWTAVNSQKGSASVYFQGSIGEELL